MGQQHWATSENPQNSPGWMSTSKALSKPSPLITFLSHPQLGEVGSGKKQWETRFSHSHPPSCFAATCYCAWWRAGVAIQHLSRMYAGAAPSLPGELR